MKIWVLLRPKMWVPWYSEIHWILSNFWSTANYRCLYIKILFTKVSDNFFGEMSLVVKKRECIQFLRHKYYACFTSSFMLISLKLVILPNFHAIFFFLNWNGKKYCTSEKTRFSMTILFLLNFSRYASCRLNHVHNEANS